MSGLTIYYEGRRVGECRQWTQDKRALVLTGCKLDLLDGMVIGVSGNSDGPLTGGIVERHEADRTCILLDKPLALGSE